MTNIAMVFRWLLIFIQVRGMFLIKRRSVYPLVMTNIAIENGDLVRGFSHEKWWIFPYLCNSLPEGNMNLGYSLWL